MRRLALVPIALVAFPALLACDYDLSGCDDYSPPPIDEQYCRAVSYHHDLLDAAPDTLAAPSISSWSSAQVTLPEAGTGWIRGSWLPVSQTWALVVTPPVPVEVFNSGDEEPASATPLDLRCSAMPLDMHSDAAGLLFEPNAAVNSPWIRIGPTAEREVTVGVWDDQDFMCE